jgi:anthranilate phosphoribosyltransferase
MNAGLAMDVRAALSDSDRCVERFAALEARWPFETLLAATRSALTAPLWPVTAVGPVGLVTGSGGIPQRIPNISTIAALVAACVDGVRVVKPGSRGSRAKMVGPGGLAAKVGLRLAGSRQELARELEVHQVALLDTDLTYPWLQQPEMFTFPALAVALESSSLLPCSAAWKVNGVRDPTPELHIARCQGSSVERTLIVHGRTDLPDFSIDDVSTAGTTQFLSISPEGHRTWSLEPADVGVAQVSGTALVLPPRLSAEDAFLAIVDAEAPAHFLDLAAYAAGVVLFQAGTVASIRTGCRHARELLDRGVVARKLARIRAG